MELVPLNTISPRKMWKNEERDFTPWLVDNIEQLGSVINMQLEVEDREVAVGPYSADILAKDLETNEFIVIENQLEKTNHDHLGKCLTYASVLDAKTVVWIATEFTDEHKKAVDWLNDYTSSELSFYAIQLELWKIDEERASLRFNIICKPNNAVKIANSAKRALTENTEMQLKFWTEFRDALLATKKFGSVQTPRPQYWYDVALGKSGINISNTCNSQTGVVSIRIYINHKLAVTMYPFLLSRKEEIEESLGELLWSDNTDAKDKTITLSYQKIDFKSDEERKNAIDWLVNENLKFHRIFAKLVREYR